MTMDCLVQQPIWTGGYHHGGLASLHHHHYFSPYYFPRKRTAYPCSYFAGAYSLPSRLDDDVAFPTDIKLERPDDCITDDDKDYKICVVCGERASGYYFGALVCLPCKSFYIRCTKDGEPTFTCQCNGNCDIAKQGRIRCQYCRYQRCLMAGMCRKEKPETVQPQDGQVLCKVCGDIANGIHFGVNTCEGCKKFFRRGLVENQSYLCKSEKKCAINPRNRNNCRYCRYQKCIGVGMSREAIKMGRPKKADTNEIISSTSSAELLSSEDNTPSPRLETTSRQEKTPSPTGSYHSSSSSPSRTTGSPLFDLSKVKTEPEICDLDNHVSVEMSVIPNSQSDSSILGICSSSQSYTPTQLTTFTPASSANWSSSDSATMATESQWHQQIAHSVAPQQMTSNSSTFSSNTTLTNSKSGVTDESAMFEDDMDEILDYLSQDSVPAFPVPTQKQFEQQIQNYHTQAMQTDNFTQLSIDTSVSSMQPGVSYPQRSPRGQRYSTSTGRVQYTSHSQTNNQMYNQCSSPQGNLYGPMPHDSAFSSNSSPQFSSSHSQNGSFSPNANGQFISSVYPNSQFPESSDSCRFNSGTLNNQYGSGSQVSQFNAASPASQYNTASPASQYNAGSPASQYSAGSPASQYSAGSPNSQYNAGSPASQYNAGSPASQYNAGSPASQYNVGSPASQYNVGSPVNQYNPSSPGVQFNASVPQYSNTSQSNPMNTSCQEAKNNKGYNSFMPYTDIKAQMRINQMFLNCDNMGTYLSETDNNDLDGPGLSRNEMDISVIEISLRKNQNFNQYRSYTEYSPDSSPLSAHSGSEDIQEDSETSRLSQKRKGINSNMESYNSSCIYNQVGQDFLCERYSMLDCQSYWNQPLTYAGPMTHQDEAVSIINHILTNYNTLRDICDESLSDRSSLNVHWPKVGCEKKHWSFIQRRTIRNILGCIDFFNSLPGYEKVHTMDVKYLSTLNAFQTALIMASTDLFDEENMRFKYFWNFTVSPNNPTYYYKLHLLQNGQKLNQLKMSPVERSMLCAILFFSADVRNLANPEVLEEMRQKLINILMTHLAAQGQDPIKRVQEIFSHLPSLRHVTMWHKQLMKKMKVNMEIDEVQQVLEELTMGMPEEQVMNGGQNVAY